MTICSNCGFDETGNLCRQCGTPFPDKQASYATSPARGTLIKDGFVCPKCGTQETQVLHAPRYGDSCKATYGYLGELAIRESRGVHKLKCPECQTTFTVNIARVRAKRSRGAKKQNMRSFSLRVREVTFGNQRERFVEFVNASYEDFELRSGDAVAFSYLEDELKVIQNHTIQQYMTIVRPECP